MNRYSKVLLTAIAATVLMAPLANAQPRHDDRRPGHHQIEKKRPAVHGKKFSQQHAPHHWKRGERVSDWKRRAATRDYYRHGLKRPSRNQQWVRIDNEYLLINLATGIIAGIVAAH